MKAKHLTKGAIFAREQVCRRRLHAGIQGRVKMLRSAVNNHCDLTLSVTSGQLRQSSEMHTAQNSTPENILTASIFLGAL